MHISPKLLLAALLGLILLGNGTYGQVFHDLGVQVTGPSETLRTGQPFTFTLTITNAGPWDASWVSVTVDHEDQFSLGEELWYLATPQNFSNYVEILDGTFADLPAFAYVTYSFTAVALRPGQHRLSISAQAGEEEYNVLENSRELLLSVSQGPGLITLDREAYIMPENGAGVIVVGRFGGDEMPIAVSFATSNATALAHSDFLPVSGRLVFAPGELTKKVVIPAIYDPAPGCNKSLTFHLFNSEGGAFLLRYTNASVTIGDTAVLAGYVRPVSVSTNDPRQLAGGQSSGAALSADGRKLAFLDTGLLDPYSEPWQWRMILHDVVTRRSEEEIAYGFAAEKNINPLSFEPPVLSGDARVMAFTGTAYDFEAEGEFNYIFCRAGPSNSNVIIQAPSLDHSLETLMLSSNGTLLAYEQWLWSSFENDILAYDFLRSSTETITVSMNGGKPNETSTLLGVNATGRYVVFQSWASNLVANDTNNSSDIFLRDRLARKTELISVNGSGRGPRPLPSFGPAAVSADGRYVAFVGSRRPTVPPEPPGFLTHIFVRDRAAAITRRASIEPARTHGEWFNANFATMSDDGRYVAYHSFDLRSENTDDNKEIVDVYLTDMQTGESTLISANCRGTGGGNAPSYWPRISGNGEFVFFTSHANDLVSGEILWGDRNLLRWDRTNRRSSIVSANLFGSGGAAGEHAISGISHDGRVLAFSSAATNLVSGDINWYDDIFAWTEGRRPALTINRTDDLLEIRWSAGAPPCVLESRMSGDDWVAVEGHIEITDERQVYRVSIPGAISTRFFRLRLL